MRKFYWMSIIIFLTTSNAIQDNELGCKEFKKFSTEYFKCNAQLIKDKTLSTGKKIIKDTKEFQEKEWSEGKKQKKQQNLKKKNLQKKQRKKNL